MCQEHLHFSKGDAVNTIFYFEIGALVASFIMGLRIRLIKRSSCNCSYWLYVYDYICCLFYTNATSVMMVNISLFALGALIFGPQLLIGVSLTGFVPEKCHQCSKRNDRFIVAYLFG